ncbi:MAG: NuoM family protein [Phycisphaerales bacterium]
MLASFVFIPLLAAAVISLANRRHAARIATIGTLIPFIPLFLLLGRMDWSLGNRAQLLESASWFPSLGINLTLGATNVGVLLLALTILLGPICVVASYSAITNRIKTYYFWLLILQAAMSGVFIARDVMLFYVFFEFTLIPMFVLISLFGSTNRKAAAIKFFLYTFTGSVLALAGLVYVAWYHATSIDPGRWTFDLDELRAASAQLPLATQSWIFFALLAGFAVKVPVFPLHTWLPLAHTEAPTAGSVILAGVLLKLGTFGILVVAIPFCPLAALEAQTFVAALGCVGILVAGLICWVQTDVKKLVAYSSVAHLGFCLLGMFAFNPLGLQGSILYMINHGLSTGALFLCIGMIYERYHTRSMKELGGLAARMPIWATFMVFFTMASVGLPGTNGFISEFLCLIGAFQASDQWTAGAPGGLPGSLGFSFAFIAGTGMIVAAMYLLYMLGKVVWGPLVEPHAHAHAASDADAHALPPDLSPREIGVLVPLAALCLLFGLYPKPLTDALEPAVRDTTALVDAARARGEPRPRPRVDPTHQVRAEPALDHGAAEARP